MTDEEAFRALVGHWRMVDCTARHADGSESKPVGSDAVGELFYTEQGQMSSQLMSAGADDPGVLPYHGYFGPFRVDAAQGIVTHRVLASSERHDVGTDQPRKFSFVGKRLVLEADRGDWVARVTWEKDTR